MMYKTASDIGDIVLEKLARPRWLKKLIVDAPDAAQQVLMARKGRIRGPSSLSDRLKKNPEAIDAGYTRALNQIKPGTGSIKGLSEARRKAPLSPVMESYHDGTIEGGDIINRATDLTGGRW
ncbi:MAG: hypothetical protein GY833_07305 [Aestuariibacter sp.]|nr:hypothetical protein [Aestuariibacter sp.]